MAMLILRVYWEKDNFLQLLIILFLFFTMVVRLVRCTLYSVSGLVNQVYPSAYEPAVVLCIPVLPIGKQTSFPPHIQWENVRKNQKNQGFPSSLSLGSLKILLPLIENKVAAPLWPT